MQKAILDGLQSEIDSNYQRGISAVKELRAYYETQTQLLTKLQPLPQRQKRPRDEIIEEIIKATEGDFNIFGIYQKLPPYLKPDYFRDPRIISQVINRMKQREPSEIEVVEAGKGSRSGIYKLAKK